MKVLALLLTQMLETRTATVILYAPFGGGVLLVSVSVACPVRLPSLFLLPLLPGAARLSDEEEDDEEEDEDEHDEEDDEDVCVRGPLCRLPLIF